MVVNTRGGLRVSADRPGDHAALANNMKILDIPQSGKCGTTVSVRTRYGLVRRRYAIPTDRRSPAQLRIRSAFGRVVSRWRGLTEDQRASWTPATQGVNSRPSVGQSGRLSGYLLFIKINSALAYQGQALVDTPPKRVTFDANPVGPLVATNTDGVFDLKLSVPALPLRPFLCSPLTRAARACRSPSTSRSSACCPLRKPATAASPTSMLPGTASPRPGRASSSAPGKCSTAGKMTPSRPRP